MCGLSHFKQQLSKCRDKRPGRITVISEVTIMPIYSRPEGQSLLRATVYEARRFKTSCNENSLRKLVINLWRFESPEKSYCKKRLVYAVGGYNGRKKLRKEN